MQPFTTLTGVAVPYVRDNITTDEIAPQQMMRRLDPDYREMLFLRQRRRADGSENPAANGAAPFTADLPTQRIGGPGGPDISFGIAPADRMRLLEGLDDIGLTLKHLGEIAAWEQRAGGERPWLQTAVDRRR